MTEISETEIKSMTKEQNYMRGYEDGKSDVLDKIRAEIEQMNENALNLLMPFDSIDNANYTRGFIDGLGSALDCIDKYRNEVSE